MSHNNSPVLIPTVDISSFLANPFSKEAELVVSKIKDACMAVGFFQIIGHGISPDLQEVVFQGAKSFFSLPQDIKKRYVGSPGRGYELIGTQALDPNAKPDLKELLKILARGVPNLNAQILEDFCHEPIASVRLLHYPPHPASDDPRL
ncbi:hypothetical protein F66182_17991, partial [Fusarium sp. NRRL 66182]